MVGDDAVEHVVVTSWWAALDVDSAPSGDSNFFALGGDSLSAVELAERVESLLEITFPLELLFRDGRLSAVTDACRRLHRARGTGSGVDAR